jgi:two-component system OmpR family sensor kinase
VTLRARLLVAAGVVLAVMVATGVLVVATQRHFLVEQVDDQLEAAAGPVGRLPPAGSQTRIPGPPPSSPSSSPSTGGIGADSGALSALWVGAVYPDGTVVARIAPGLGPSAAPVVDPAVARAAARTGEAFTAPADDGSTSYRLIARGVDDATVALIGLPLTTVEEATRQLVAALAIGGLVMVAFVGLLGWWVWRLGLRPIQRITAAAEAVRAGDRDHRVEEFPAGTEAGEMAAALNTMLDERQLTEDGLRRFVGDASHELRSPLTTIGGYVELYQRGGLAEPGALDDAMRRIAAESSRMAGLVDDLLLLARLDQARPLATEPVDVALVLRDAATDTAAVAPQRAVHLEVTEPLMVVGDEQRLRQVVTAVVGNALVHTPPEAALWLRGRPRPGGGAVVEIHDDGPGMAPEVAAHAFERFYRGDPSRARTRSGSGLGLAIVASIVQGHGGTVELDTAPGQGTTVRIALPSGHAAPSPTNPPAPANPAPANPAPANPAPANPAVPPTAAGSSG